MKLDEVEKLKETTHYYVRLTVTPNLVLVMDGLDWLFLLEALTIPVDRTIS